jgi:ribosomal protein L20
MLKTIIKKFTHADTEQSSTTNTNNKAAHKRTTRNGMDKCRFIDHRSKQSIKNEFSTVLREYSTFKDTLKSFIKDRHSEFSSLNETQKKTFNYVYERIKASNSYMRFLMVQINKACNDTRSDTAEAIEHFDANDVEIDA